MGPCLPCVLLAACCVLHFPGLPCPGSHNPPVWLHALSRALTVSQALKRIDTEGVLFFLGVLMAVGALESAGLLKVGPSLLELSYCQV